MRSGDVCPCNLRSGHMYAEDLPSSSLPSGDMPAAHVQSSNVRPLLTWVSMPASRLAPGGNAPRAFFHSSSALAIRSGETAHRADTFRPVEPELA